MAELLAEAHDLLRKGLESTDYYKVSDDLRGFHDRLVNITAALDKLKQKPDLAPHDLLPVRRRLGEIDALYYEAGFPTEGHQYPEGQVSVF